MLGSDVPRRLQCSLLKPLAAYTDACGAGALGATVFLDGKVIFPHKHATGRISEMGIGAMGKSATVRGMCVASEVAPGRNIRLFAIIQAPRTP